MCSFAVLCTNGQNGERIDNQYFTKISMNFKKINIVVAALAVFLISMSFSTKQTPSVKSEKSGNLKDNLSEYGFFEGKMSDLKPAKGVVPYTLNAPLFSDYAQKYRFVQLPDGQTVDFNADSVFQFPIGTKIIKGDRCFYENACCCHGHDCSWT